MDKNYHFLGQMDRTIIILKSYGNTARSILRLIIAVPEVILTSVSAYEAENQSLLGACHFVRILEHFLNFVELRFL